MYSTSKYLISGATAETSGSVSVLGMDKFTVQMIGESNGVNQATGTMSVMGRLDSSAPYSKIFSNSFAGNSGVFVQFDGPMESIMASLGANPTGTFSAIIRYSSSK